MSGGVDSSVAALVLLQQGHDVIGLFMRNWNDASVTLEDECPWIEDSRDAMLVAEHLGIPFQILDLSEVYKTRIIDYMFDEYGKGRTPNPDILCNREIKFSIFLEEALKLGADFVATGHYARKESVWVNGNEEFRLLMGKDLNKDQSYFLCQLNQSQLSKALFPIGEMQKSAVRELAEKTALATASKKDSQGLCFIGHVRLPEFLQQQLQVKEGDVIEIDNESSAVKTHWQNVKSRNGLKDKDLWHAKFDATDGQCISRHQGAYYFTRGQRKGLNIGGKPQPLFIIHTDVEKNLIFVGQGEDHLGLYSAGLFVDDKEAHWLRPSVTQRVLDSDNVQGRFRYRQELFFCQVLKSQNGYNILFQEPQKSVSPGQFIALYLEGEIVFSGVISF